MASLFNQNIPIAESAIKSSELRDNFNALYEKVKTLEARATTPESTSVLISGGPCYFRASESNNLKYFPFYDTLLDIESIKGYQTYRDAYGSLQRREIEDNVKGPSNFQNNGGRYLEVLLSLKSNGQVTFTESLNAQTTKLSSYFNIYFNDEEIPIALVFLEKNSAGALQSIKQTDITDIRPLITTAFQNNLQIADLEATVSNHSERIEVLEPSLKVADSFKVKLPSSEITTSSNTLIEVSSGEMISPDGYLLRFPGCFVDFKIDATTISNENTIAAGTSSGGSGNYFYKALIYATYNSGGSYLDNTTIAVTHSSGVASAADLNTINVSFASNAIPLAYVCYRKSSTPSVTPGIYPLVSESLVGGVQFAYIYDIISFSSLEIVISLNLSSPYTIPSALSSGQSIDIYDNNTRPMRRVIQTSTYNSVSSQLTIRVYKAFAGISLDKNPKFRSSSHISAIEDLRSFIGR